MNLGHVQKKSTIQINASSSNTASPVLDNSPQNEGLQRKADLMNNAAQRAEAPRPNNTGMPDNLKIGIESLSGFSMDDVRVHYNSSKPATVQALAYTQGTDIHVAPGQEKHLPHEAWHVAQQMAGRVSPTTNINGMPVNDNAALEHEADVMGEKAVTQRKENFSYSSTTHSKFSSIVQFLPNYQSPDKRPTTVGLMSIPINQLGGLQMTRHHIIPWHIINNFLANVFQHGDYTIPKIANKINDFLSMNAINVLGNGSDGNVTAIDLDDYINNNNQGTHGVNELNSSLQACVTWIPWNIFEGPTPQLRTDDPKEKFESNAYFILGAEKFKKIRRLHDLLKAYNEGNGANPELAFNIANRLSSLSHTYRDVAHYNPEQWRIQEAHDKNGLFSTSYSIKTSKF